MTNAPRYLLIVAAGIAAMAWGLPSAHRLKPPKDILAAAIVLAGVAMIITGALLTVLPRFFLE